MAGGIELQRVTGTAGEGEGNPAVRSLNRLARLASRALRSESAFACLREGLSSTCGAWGGRGPGDAAEPWHRTPLGRFLCEQPMTVGSPLIVIGDVRAHPLTAAIPDGDAPGVVACAGVALVSRPGNRLGSLWAVDPAPRAWTESDIATLRDLAELATAEIELRDDLAERDRTEVALLRAHQVVESQVWEHSEKLARSNASLFESLQRTNVELTLAYDATIEGWSRALDLRDRETEGHTRRVTEMTLRLAHAMGIAGVELVHIRRGALLHDIGKMGIPDAILLKPGPLDAHEQEIMRRHPAYAFEMLAPITFLGPAIDIPYCHHEKWDGSGYPRGLKGEQIPLSARIFAVADIWDALRSDRPYRKGWPEKKVREHIQSLAGTHLDQSIVRAFLEHMARDASRQGAGSPTGHARVDPGRSGGPPPRIIHRPKVELPAGRFS